MASKLWCNRPFTPAAVWTWAGNVPVLLETQQASGIRHYWHSWHTVDDDPLDSENKGGGQNVLYQIWEAFPSCKLVLPSHPKFVNSTKAWFQHTVPAVVPDLPWCAACWLKAAAAACNAEVYAKESELFEYLPVRFPLPAYCCSLKNV